MRLSTLLVALILILLPALGCGPHLIGGLSGLRSGGSSVTLDIDTGGGGPLAPASLTITTDAPLMNTTVLAGTELTVSATGPLPVGAGIAPVLGGNSPALGGLTIFGASAAAPSVVGLSNASPLTAVLASAAFSANISISASWPGGTSQACSLLAPFASLPCSLGGFTINRSDITSTGDLRVKGYAANGGTNDYLLSNALPASVVTVKQVTKISGSNATDDLVDSLKVYNDKLMMSSIALYRYDPLTNTLTQPMAATGNMYPNTGITYHGKYYFTAYNNSGAFYKVHVYDDATGVITQVSNTRNNNSADDSPSNYYVFNDKLFFISLNSSGFNKLYRYDDAGPALIQVTNTQNGNGFDDNISAGSYFLFGAGGVLFMSARNSNSQYKTYAWDDGAGALTQLTNSVGNNTFSDSPSGFTLFNSRVYFQSRNANGAYKLLRYDPAAVNKLTEASNTTNNGFADENPQDVTVYNGKLFFSAFITATNRKLYRYDDATGNVVQISNTRGGTNDDLPAYLTVYNNKLFFVGLNPSNRTKVYMYDDVAGTLKQITNTNGTGNNDVNAGSDPFFTVYGGKLYFRANNASGVAKLFAYDDVTGTLAQVMNNRPAATADLRWGSGVRPVIYSNRMAFVAYSTGGGEKIFSLCDPVTGCTP